MPCYEKFGGTLSDLMLGSLVLAVSLDIMQSGNNDEWILLERKIWTFYLALILLQVMKQ